MELMDILAIGALFDQRYVDVPAPYRLEINEGRIDLLVWSSRRQRWLLASRAHTVRDPLDDLVQYIRRPKYEILLEQGCSEAELQQAIEEYEKGQERRERQKRAELIQLAQMYATRNGRWVNGPSNHF